MVNVLRKSVYCEWILKEGAEEWILMPKGINMLTLELWLRHCEENVAQPDLNVKGLTLTLLWKMFQNKQDWAS